MIRLGQAMDGRLIVGSNEPFPADVKHVEYYKEQRLFSLVFETEDEESRLMPCELCEKTAAIVQASPNIMVIAMAEAGAEPYGYMVPLVQIGV
ncbi:MAG: hypothetical protein DI551_07230 [Micavibrio aeruginosavorus]|uniref:Uncharacterized protein n=1 Tax=Micavibrio aeruginosavorus TaxID=349221 RepID=A0A2W5MWA9_9BACT|nr:MAG: hypothetical protein DI551_07230 [Micavibrio aeruginosavorus]